MAKNNELSYVDFFKSIYQFDLFSKKFSKSKLIGTNLAILTLVLIITILNTVLSYTKVEFFGLGTLVYLGIPLILLLVYALLHLMISAFEPIKKKFSEGYQVFSFISLMFIIIGNMITMLMIVTTNPVLSKIFEILTVGLIVYLVFCITLNLKNYLQISWQRVLTTEIFVTMFFMAILLVEYLVYLLSLIRQG